MNMTKPFLPLLAALFLLGGCDDNDPSPSITPEAQKAFSEKYPSATHVSWEKKGTYLVAEFNTGNQSADAWFDVSGDWFMTETDLNWEGLPEAVRTTFQSSQYAQWKIEEVDMIERKNVETLYVIQVEKGEQELDLYFSPTGIFIQAIADGDDHSDLLPSPMPEQIKAAVLKMYPEARFVDIETEKGVTEATIIDGTRSKEVRFDASAQWLETEYDVLPAELPAAVTETLNTQYGSPYLIDEAECHETPAGNFFHIEVEKSGKEFEINIQEDGTIRP